MKTFSPADIIAYYDQTEVHYRLFWGLEKSMGLHYGIWDKDARTLVKAVKNTNRQLALLGNITADDVVLDAGCGVGGSAIFLAKMLGCRVIGITLSEKQVATATYFAQEHGVSDLVHFLPMDYTQTTFADASFSVVWAIESMETAADKSLFVQEANRVLKPGGRLLVGDVFKNHTFPIDEEPTMRAMLNGWAMSDALTIPEFSSILEAQGFYLRSDRDVTPAIYPSAWRMYWAGWAGMAGSKLYAFYRRARYFSRTHYRTGIAQYQALRKGLWNYHLCCAVKRGDEERITRLGGVLY
jgi:cyclopropane fatty-acyl-phospholipid synthase-like methyltransferase